MKKKEKIFVALILFYFIFFSNSNAFSKVKYSVGVNYTSWGLWFIENMMENMIEDAVKGNLQEQIENDFSGYTLGDYTQDINLKSSGNGINVQLRIYPGGENGVFSLGINYFKLNSTLDLTGNVIQYFVPDSNYIELNATGVFEINYSAFLVDFRWDLLPESMIHPYISIGGGISPLKGKIIFNGEGSSYINQIKDTYSYNEDEKLEDIEDIPTKILPVLQLNLGIKADINRYISISVDGGVWNGFLIKMGVLLSY